MPAVDVVFLVCWIAFWVYWLAASVGVKSGRTRWGQFAGARVVLILVVLLLAKLKLVKLHDAVTASPWLQGTGLVIFFLGLALAIWARLYLGRNWGMPMTEKADPELVTSGPYRTIRHPIYSGIILAMVGTTVGVSVYWLVAVVLIGGYFVYSATREEHYMAGRFPDTYPPYRQATKMLIPFIV